VLLGPQDLDRVLVRADRSVGAEAEEDRTDRAGRLDVQRRVEGQARPGDVVVDADGEPAPRALAASSSNTPATMPGVNSFDDSP
jgi:hypothetical protein